VSEAVEGLVCGILAWLPADFPCAPVQGLVIRFELVRKNKVEGAKRSKRVLEKQTWGKGGVGSIDEEVEGLVCRRLLLRISAPDAPSDGCSGNGLRMQCLSKCLSECLSECLAECLFQGHCLFEGH
jgi:hypothetical protein